LQLRKIRRGNLGPSYRRHPSPVATIKPLHLHPRDERSSSLEMSHHSGFTPNPEQAFIHTTSATIILMGSPKILAVDDDANITALIHAILAPEGCDVCEENRPFAAIKTAREFRPDLVLLDLDMPGKDGATIASEMRDDPLLRNTPVVFISSMITKSDELAHPDQHRLSKPVDPAILRQTVRELCP
jgi:CheY-like chemotaxis protein